MPSVDDSSRTEKAVLALLALNLADREERLRVESTSQAPRNETVLAKAGFSAREIADLTGRDYEAVKSALRRASKTGSKKGGD